MALAPHANVPHYVLCSFPVSIISARSNSSTVCECFGSLLEKQLVNLVLLNILRACLIGFCAKLEQEPWL